ncbi:hypothetical protein BTR14_13155 [Rhizobium rhizosphaerae]|uniref:Uncharacterized protein n=1 Tax=Xaviernesmea rhizosphaerae TaxID=1672749 RepID=A0ABX3PCT2_9HYPH|nr:hypothetical protein [Xaviernesmea rhizosphaerae]OQP86025.1 hypothetical protein BTR14_13155 [Xaviernesmea rhizosphaerae]
MTHDARSSDVIARAICAEFSIKIIPANEQPQPGQTRAIGTLRRIADKHGEAHLRMVVSTLAETTGNQGLITETSLWAVSDLVIACSQWIEEDASSWFAAWDAIPLGATMWRCMALSGVINQRHALGGAVYLLLLQHRENAANRRPADYGFLRRVDASEALALPAARRRADEKQMIEDAGRRLLQVKAALPHGAFLKWVEVELNIPQHRVSQYMRKAGTGWRPRPEGL